MNTALREFVRSRHPMQWLCLAAFVFVMAFLTWYDIAHGESLLAWTRDLMIGLVSFVTAWLMARKRRW